jgi:hypothetical protein
LIAAVFKIASRVRGSWVRIPPPPPRYYSTGGSLLLDGKHEAPPRRRARACGLVSDGALNVGRAVRSIRPLEILPSRRYRRVPGRCRAWVGRVARRVVSSDATLKLGHFGVQLRTLAARLGQHRRFRLAFCDAQRMANCPAAPFRLPGPECPRGPAESGRKQGLAGGEPGCHCERNRGVIEQEVGGLLLPS